MCKTCDKDIVTIKDFHASQDEEWKEHLMKLDAIGVLPKDGEKELYFPSFLVQHDGQSIRRKVGFVKLGKYPRFSLLKRNLRCSF